MYHKMVIFFDTPSILPPAIVLDICLETPVLKALSTSCAKLRCLLFVQEESFLIGKPWSFLNFEDFFPRLTFTCFCFICGTLLLVFIYDYRKCRRLSESYFPSSGWMSPLFPCVDRLTYPSTFQWNCPT